MGNVVGKGEFPCTGCGACCRRIWDFAPELAGPDGVCKHLGGDNLCTIYDDRPDYCHINIKLANQERIKNREEPFKTKEEFFRANRDLCNQFQEEDKMDEKYRVEYE